MQTTLDPRAFDRDDATVGEEPKTSGLPKLVFTDDDADPEVTALVRPSSMREEVKPRSEQRACFIVIAGNAVGDVFRLGEMDAVIGRASGAKIRLEDAGISRRHARVTERDGEVVLEDLGSANGTFVNGERIDRRVLQDGDKLQVGSTTILKFTFQDEYDESFQRNMLEAARRDGLTKAYSKAYFGDQMEKEVSFSNRHGVPLSLVMFDLDHFKRINDNLGHVTGDAVLIELAKLCRSTLRTEDVFARYGGEEFAVICRATALADAALVAERIRRTVEEAKFPVPPDVSVTVSVGVAEHGRGGTPTDLVKAADARLYGAKGAGRNRVMSTD